MIKTALFGPTERGEAPCAYHARRRLILGRGGRPCRCTIRCTNCAIDASLTFSSLAFVDFLSSPPWPRWHPGRRAHSRCLVVCIGETSGRCTIRCSTRTPRHNPLVLRLLSTWQMRLFVPSNVGRSARNHKTHVVVCHYTS